MSHPVIQLDARSASPVGADFYPRTWEAVIRVRGTELRFIVADPNDIKCLINALTNAWERCDEHCEAEDAKERTSL